jgi:hypothetical protein
MLARFWLYAAATWVTLSVLQKKVEDVQTRCEYMSVDIDAALARGSVVR